LPISVTEDNTMEGSWEGNVERVFAPRHAYVFKRRMASISWPIHVVPALQTPISPRKQVYTGTQVSSYRCYSAQCR